MNSENSTAISIAKGAIYSMADLLTTDELEEVLTILGKRIPSAPTKAAYKLFWEEYDLKEVLQFQSPEEVKQRFYEDENHPDYYNEWGIEGVEGINWGWIYSNLIINGTEKYING